MKVYGWRGHKSGMTKSQARFIVAAKSVSEVMRLTGMTRYQFNQDGCETGNDGEVAQAMSAPGVIFYRDLNHWQDEPWSRDIEAEIRALGVCPHEDCPYPVQSSGADCGNHETWMT